MKELFTIRKEHNKNYRFEVKNEAGQFLFNSVSFSDKKEMKTTIKELQSLDIGTFIFERKTNYNGNFHFNLKTADNRILGNSGQFSSQAGMENGIKHLKNRIKDFAQDFDDL